MRLYLIGMPGCGKSTLGKKLAAKLNYEFIDMDTYIEKMNAFREAIAVGDEEKVRSLIEEANRIRRIIR